MAKMRKKTPISADSPADAPLGKDIDPTLALLETHVAQLQTCRLCKDMQSTPVCGGAVKSRVLLVGQAPGDKEPARGKLFAFTAGKTLFQWFETYCHVSEAQFRERVYMAAVCRCFPGKKKGGGDRVPSPTEIRHCAPWLQAEIHILRPRIILPLGRLAIAKFLNIKDQGLDTVVGKVWKIQYPLVTPDSPAETLDIDVIPLPHPSGASPWHRNEPGKSLLRKALTLIYQHPVFRMDICGE